MEEFKNVSEMPENVCEKIDSLFSRCSRRSTAVQRSPNQHVVGAGRTGQYE